MSITWEVWKERSSRIFEDNESGKEEIWEKNSFNASLWASCSTAFSDLNVASIYHNWNQVLRQITWVFADVWDFVLIVDFCYV